MRQFFVSRGPMVLRRLLFGCLLTCGLAQAAPMCYTVYINEPAPYYIGPFLIPVLVRVKVVLLITGDNVTSYKQIDGERATEVYVNGSPTQVLPTQPTCSELLAGQSR